MTIQLELDNLAYWQYDIDMDNQIIKEIFSTNRTPIIDIESEWTFSMDDIIKKYREKSFTECFESGEHLKYTDPCGYCVDCGWVLYDDYDDYKSEYDEEENI
jgi:hypothetical protein